MPITDEGGVFASSTVGGKARGIRIGTTTARRSGVCVFPSRVSEFDDSIANRMIRELRASANARLSIYDDQSGNGVIDSQDVNDYLRDIAAIDVTAKDFRTWLTSAQAASQLYNQRHESNARQRKNTIVNVTK